jgi:serine protease Do
MIKERVTVKKSRICLIIIVFTLALILLSGCALPGYPAKSSTPSPTTPYSETTTAITPPAASATPSSTPTYTSNPINPEYTPTAVIPNAQTEVLPDYVSVIAKVRPSVVVIHTEVPTFDIFAGTTTQKGAGSGWVFDSSGLVVTNNHVIEGANSITITLDDGRNFTAQTVRTDPVTDLAVIKIDAPGLTALGLADSARLKVGALVVAIGNSLDEGISATNGIISATGISITTESGEVLYDLIKTNAAINPGNSGGPLVDMEGKVIGITGAKVAQVGVEGTGYAISLSVAYPIINELIKNGYVSRPWLGVSLYTVDQTAVQALHLSVNKGVLIRQVVNGSPSDKAGLKRYDVVTSFDGTEVKSKEELVKLVRKHSVGQTVPVDYWRGSNKATASLTLEQSPPPSSP